MKHLSITIAWYKMKVAMYYSNEDVRLEEMPIPKIGAGELLVKVWASGICGSDVMEWYRIKKAPRVLGHEIGGEIVEVGEGVSQYKKGDRVFVSHHVPCNQCRYCKKGYHTLCDTLRSTNFDPGGFSEYIRVPRINVEQGVYLLPDKMSYEEATFIEPLGCVVRGQRLTKVQRGDTVLVLGSGISGLLHIQLARVRGAKIVIATDINEYRLLAAKNLGADAVINAKKEAVPLRVKEINQGRLADRVIICTPALTAISQAFHSADRGGSILFFAPTEPGIEVRFPLFELWDQGVNLTSTYAAVDKDLNKSIELIKSGKVRVQEMITHRLSLEETWLGFKLVTQARESIKVIIEPHR